MSAPSTCLREVLGRFQEVLEVGADLSQKSSEVGLNLS